MTQYARPSSDILTDSIWSPSTGTDLYSCVNETSSNDSPDVRTTSSSTGYDELGLSTVTDPEVNTDHVLTYRCRRNPTNRAITFVMRLMQGSTEIASWTHTNEPNAYTTYNQELSTAQADAITDYSALRVRLDITSSHVQGRYYVSWIQFEVPDAPVVVPTNCSIIVGGSWKTVSETRIIVSGSWKKVDSLKVIADGAWEDIY